LPTTPILAETPGLRPGFFAVFLPPRPLPECDDETTLIAGEQISISPGSFGPERSLEIVLNPGLFFDLRKADQSLLELFRDFPLVSWERAEEG
jgi:hypothetical protein